MGKLAQKSSRSTRRSRGARVLRVRGAALSADQKRKYAQLREWLQEQMNRASRMTPAEREEEERAWQQFKGSINSARSGYREVIVD